MNSASFAWSWDRSLWGGDKMNIKNRRGQNLLEYATVVALVTAAVIAMSTYVFRSVQSTQQMIQDEFTSQ